MPAFNKIFPLSLCVLLTTALPALAQDSPFDSGDTAWMLVATLLVLMMTVPGLALFYGGLVKRDNVLSALVQSIAVAVVVSVVWPVIGYSLSFTLGQHFYGSPNHSLPRWFTPLPTDLMWAFSLIKSPLPTYPNNVIGCVSTYKSTVLPKWTHSTK